MLFRDIAYLKLRDRAIYLTESPATAEPPATETDEQVDPFKVGSRVYWTNCPVCCGKFGPFEIMWIEGEYAKLDLFPDLVPLKELLRRD